MKTSVMFLSVIVLVSSGKFIFGKCDEYNENILEERTHIFSPTATPLMNVQINEDEYRQGYIGFCHDCAWACFRRNKSLARCKKFKCRCS
ncbi:hypothetical protein YC2023_084565 [Brassica napus]